MDYPDLVDLDAQRGGDELRPGGLVALAVRRGAGDHRDGPVRLDLDTADLGPEAGHLDVGRQADAELEAVAAGAPLGLLPPESLVAGELQGTVQGGHVVAGVVAGPGHGGVGEDV